VLRRPRQNIAREGRLLRWIFILLGKEVRQS
jgi:hypothetical protein